MSETPRGRDTFRLIALFALSFAVLLTGFWRLNASPAKDQSDHGPAVGFHLTLDYGTATVYFPNGTWVDIAKIEGGPQYKETMRNAKRDDKIPGRVMYPGTSMATPDHSQLVVYSEADRYHVKFAPPQTTDHPSPTYLSQKVDSITKSIGSWLYRDTSADGIAHMLLALKAATESFLEEQLTIVDMSVPWSLRGDEARAFWTVQKAAFRAAGLQDRGSSLSAGYLAARYYEIPVPPCGSFWPPKDEQELVLNVDYSRAAITASIYHNECGCYDPHQPFHSTRLGAEALSECRRTRNPLNCRAELKAALFSVAKLPLSPLVDAPEAINRVVVTGDSASDPLFSDVLREVLRETGSYEALSDPGSSYGAPYSDPVFVPSRGLARLGWNWRLSS